MKAPHDIKKYRKRSRISEIIQRKVIMKTPVTIIIIIYT